MPTTASTREAFATQPVKTFSTGRHFGLRYNPSILHCRRGCDFGTGRVNDPKERMVAQEMCKRYTAELYKTERGELGSLPSSRKHQRSESTCRHVPHRAKQSLQGLPRRRQETEVLTS